MRAKAWLYAYRFFLVPLGVVLLLAALLLGLTDGLSAAFQRGYALF